MTLVEILHNFLQQLEEVDDFGKDALVVTALKREALRAIAEIEGSAAEPHAERRAARKAKDQE